MIKSLTNFFYFLFILKCSVLYITGKADDLNTGPDGVNTDNEEDDAVAVTDVDSDYSQMNSSWIKTDPPKDDGPGGNNTNDLKEDYEMVGPMNQISGFSFDDKEMAKFKIWPKGVVSYYIDDYSYDKILRDKIRKFLNDVTWQTGVRFLELVQLPIKDVNRYVFFINRRSQLECSDYTIANFTTEGAQRVVLGYDCVNDQHMAAVLLALLSIPPQHNAPDRDGKIYVSRHNILPDKMEMFTRLKNQDWLFHDLPYDFGSAGHYDNYKYTKNGGATIEPLDPDQLIEPNKGLSALDVKKIRLMYNYVMINKLPKQVSDCSKLYRPGPGMNTESPLWAGQFPIPSKPLDKPAKYYDTNNTNQNDTQFKPDEDDYHYDDTNYKNVKNKNDNNSNSNIKNSNKDNNTKIDLANDNDNQISGDDDINPKELMDELPDINDTTIKTYKRKGSSKVPQRLKPQKNKEKKNRNTTKRGKSTKGTKLSKGSKSTNKKQKS